MTSLWGNQQKSETLRSSADILCQDLRRKLTGRRPDGKYYRDVTKLADIIQEGGFEELAGVPRAEIMMKYENR